ncbi:unnamed protein product [Calypogeia fissa]
MRSTGWVLEETNVRNGSNVVPERKCKFMRIIKVLTCSAQSTPFHDAKTMERSFYLRMTVNFGLLYSMV